MKNKNAVAVLLVPIAIIISASVYKKVTALPETPEVLVDSLLLAMSNKDVDRIGFLCNESSFKSLYYIGESKEMESLVSVDSRNASPWDVWKKWSIVLGHNGFSSKPKQSKDNPNYEVIGDRWEIFAFSITDDGNGWYIHRVLHVLNPYSINSYKLDKPFLPNKWE